VSAKDAVRLPQGVGRYLRTRRDKKAGAIVRQLHRWMKHKDLVVMTLEPWHVDEFVQRPFGKRLAARTRYDYRGELLNYLQWLYERGDLPFDPSKLRRGRFARRTLPELAEQFVASLAATLRPGTCHCYRSNLGHFCRWSNEQDIVLEHLDRIALGRFFAHLLRQGLSPSRRSHILLEVRAYLRWLYDQGLLDRDPELLIRRSDLPKCPQYLPRPISPEADRTLCTRLAASSCRYDQGLLLMRKTGLRIGELVALDYDCVRSDVHGNAFLKVPIGKLHNERLVPLDAATAELVASLQRSEPQDRTTLLVTPHGCRTVPDRLRRALREACDAIPIDGRMCTHRLRHTYATTLLSGGMSLVGVMRLLGHRSYHTTLRYAAITQETIGREYFEALGQIEQRYQRSLGAPPSGDLDPRRTLSDLARWIHRHVAHDLRQARLARLLIKRLKRIEIEIQPLIQRGEPS
jgi:site-specific recombinase XerD